MAITVLSDIGETTLADAEAVGDALWVPSTELAGISGWTLNPQGFCKGDLCVPIPPGREVDFVAGGRIDVAQLWRHLEQPLACAEAGDVWVLGVAASARAARLADLQAPDVTLPDAEGRPIALSQFRGRKVLLATWASWCGCRADLPVWQELHDRLAPRGFTVIAVALDTRDAAQPWIDIAKPTYPCLIDAEHRVADLFHMTNVPQATWIDEAGRIVRPPENAGQSDVFRYGQRAPFAMTPEQVAERQRVKAIYIEAVADWVQHGDASRHVYDPAAARARVRLPTSDMAMAHAHFRLAQVLASCGRVDEADVHFATATRLHPESWAMWRQAAPKEADGFATGPEFWARVDALGEKPYHLPIDLDGLADRTASEGGRHG